MRGGATGDHPARASGTQLVAADQLHGMLVLAPDGTRLGVIRGLIIDRASGSVAFAILALGGLGEAGRSRVPLPWSRLRFDPARQTYVLAVSAALLTGAPRPGDGTAADWTDHGWTRRIERHYAAAHGRFVMPPHGM
jgi:hypothetical protein